MSARRATSLFAALAGTIFAVACLNPTVQNAAGSIAGTVTPPSSKATLYAIFTATGDTITVALADTVTGAYRLNVLPPGDYRVTAVGSGLNASKTLTLRNGQDTTGVNFP